MPRIRLLASFLATVVALGLLWGCQPSPPPPPPSPPAVDTVPTPPPPVDHSTFRADLEKALGTLREAPDYSLMGQIPAAKLFAYFSGHIPSSHPFPLIYLDSAAHRFTVFHQSYTSSFAADSAGMALDDFRAQLQAHGYPIEGAAKVEDGTLNIADLFPDQEAAAKEFTPAQYAFLRDEVSPREAFAYLSGISNTGVAHPLMVGVGFEETARLWLMGPGLAEAWTFEQIDSAFTHYEEYVAAWR